MVTNSLQRTMKNTEGVPSGGGSQPPRAKQKITIKHILNKGETTVSPRLINFVL